MNIYTHIYNVCMLGSVQLFATPCTVTLKTLLCPWAYPRKNTGMSCHFLLQGTFPTRGSNLCLPKLLHWQADSLLLSKLRSPRLTTGIKIAEKKYQQPQIYICYHLNGRKWRLTLKILMRVKEENEKAGLKFNIQKMKFMASDSTTSWQTDG